MVVDNALEEDSGGQRGPELDALPVDKPAIRSPHPYVEDWLWAWAKQSMGVRHAIAEDTEYWKRITLYTLVEGLP